MVRRLVILSIAVFGIVYHSISFAQGPREIAGFALGSDISQYRDRLQMETEMPIRHMEYLSEVEVRAPEGFRSGLVHYGNCEKPGQIVRVSMKYELGDKAFFDELLLRFKKKFGDPSEWRGDPFHVYVAWKWSFVEKDGNRISMILQHYTGDDEEYKRGNSVKLAMTTLIEKERQCHERKECKTPGDERSSGLKGTRDKAADLKKLDFGRFIPR